MGVASVKFTLNGVETILTNSSGNNWTGTISAPGTTSYNNNADHAYYASVTAIDDAGNSTVVDYTDPTLGSDLKLRVLEKDAPTQTITYPAASAYVTDTDTPTFEWTVVDTDSGSGASGVDPSTISIAIDGGTAITSGITVTAITGGYRCEYTPSASMSQGAHSYVISATDFDGNVATSSSTSFTIDTNAPSLNITSPIDNLITNESTVTVSGTTDDATTKPVTVTVNGNSVSVDPTTGEFSTTVNLEEGSNTITVVATDTAGNSTTITRTVIKNTTPPTIVSVTLTPNPVDAGATYVVTVVATDA